MKCGFVALLGRPNVGKSTLLNALVGAKLAGVSDKAQTTRNEIRGVWIEEQSQVVFLDTPGLHGVSGKPTLNRLMMKEAWQSARSADLVLFLIDASSGLIDVDVKFLRSLMERVHKPVHILIAKSDVVKKKEHDDLLGEVNKELSELIREFPMLKAPQFVSAKVPADVASLRKALADSMPEGVWHYDSEQLTDRSQKFIVGEYIREQMFRLFGDELPYQSGVVIEEMDFSSKPIFVLADIYVERESQKRMIVGKGGSKIKEIGRKSRASIEDMLGEQVFLELFVKVKPGWINKSQWLEEIAGLQEN